MARQRRPRPVRWRGLVVAACCYMLLIRQNAGVFATTSEDDDNAAMSPTAAPETAAPATGDLATGSPETGGSAETPTPAPSDGSSEYLGCLGYTNHIKDGYCDTDLNNAECGWDGGDCCACTCGSDSDEELAHPCGQLGDGYDCQDPDVPDDCGVTPSPAAAIGYPDCEEYLYEWQDGVCDDNLNTAACGYDGGDCCRCTCRDYNSWGYYSSCGYYGYDCMDPEAPSTCSTDSPTPSPAAGTDWPECEGYIYMIGDGSCDYYNNNEECGWDGGDCCSCTCEGSSYYSCSSYSMDCQDPDANCTTPSPTPYCPWASDGYCDSYYNTEDCDWDGGDCCAYGCSSTTCLDPIYGCDSITTSYDESDDSTSTFITYVTSSDDSGCFDGDWAVSDGKCDSGNNNAACDYDGGDCCECDCYDYGEVYECGVVGYYCLDQTSLCYGSTSGGNFDSDDFYGDDDYDARGAFSFTPTPVVVTEELSLPTYSEMSVSKTELGGILALSFWGFCMLGCGAWAACGVFRKKVFGEEEEKEGGPPAAANLNRTSLNAHEQRRPRPSTERGRYSVKSRGGRRSSPSRPPLDATVAAALALPGDNRHATPTYITYDDPAVVSRSAGTGVEETKGNGEAEHGRMFRGGRSGGWDETKTEEAHDMFASSNAVAAEPGDGDTELGGGAASVDGDASVDGAPGAGVGTAAGAAIIPGDDRQASPANNVHQDPVAVGQEKEGAGVTGSIDGGAAPGAGVTTAAGAAAIPGDGRQACPANKTHQDPAAVGEESAEAGVEEEGKAEPGGVFHSGRGEGGGETKIGEENESVAADVSDVGSNSGAEDLDDGAASVDGAPSADVPEAAALAGDDAPNADATGGDDDVAGDDVSATSDQWSGDEVDAGVREVNEVAVKGAKFSPLYPPSEGER
ncbi:unnamed protein product [Ectocarpus sp. 12 AP-2014]